MQRLKTYWPYILLALIIMGPLLLPGYILTMDMVFVPHPPLPTEVNASYPFYVLLHFLSYLIPGDILQKLLLLTILSLGGIGMHRLLVYDFPRLSRWALYGASIFYVCNPFVYERLMMGQFAVVAGYSLLPFFILSLQRFLRGLSWAQLARAMCWLLLITVVSIHSVIPAIVIAMIIWLVAAWQHRGAQFWRLSLGRLVVGAACLLLVSSYWLVPTILHANTIASAVDGAATNVAFATQGNFFSILRLEGFWAEGRDLFKPAHSGAPIPAVWQLLLWTVAILGGANSIGRTMTLGAKKYARRFRSQ